METITVEKVKELAANAVREKGEDYIYINPAGVQASPERNSLCFNWSESDGERIPSCIVGNIFNQLGLLQYMEYDSAAMDAVSGVAAVATFDDDAVKVLGRLQVKQDMGTSWGQAFREVFNSDIS